MEKEEIIALLNRVICPVYQIEADLGMPKTTLQKAIKGERKLPKKWAVKLKEAFGNKEAAVLPPVCDLKPSESRKSNNPVDTIKSENDLIYEQIAAIRAEKIPPHRNTSLGKKSWDIEQQKRIDELSARLK